MGNCVKLTLQLRSQRIFYITKFPSILRKKSLICTIRVHFSVVLCTTLVQFCYICSKNITIMDISLGGIHWFFHT